MSNIAKILKDEIKRISRKEIKEATLSLRKDNVVLKHTIAEHKRRIVFLEKQNKQFIVKTEQAQKESMTEPAAEIDTTRITADMIKSTRKRLGVSQVEFAKLAGISYQIVSVWERKKGQIHFRNNRTKAAVLQVRKLTKAEALESLQKNDAEMKTGGKPSPKKQSSSTPTGQTLTETLLKAMKRFKKGVTISKLKTLTGFDDKKIRNILYFTSRQGRVKNVGRGVYTLT